MEQGGQIATGKRARELRCKFGETEGKLMVWVILRQKFCGSPVRCLVCEEQFLGCWIHSQSA